MEWISVKDDTPKANKVLVRTKTMMGNENYFMARFNMDSKKFEVRNQIVTHWAELPTNK